MEEDEGPVFVDSVREESETETIGVLVRLGWELGEGKPGEPSGEESVL